MTQATAGAYRTVMSSDALRVYEVREVEDGIQVRA